MSGIGKLPRRARVHPSPLALPVVAIAPGLAGHRPTRHARCKSRNLQFFIRRARHFRLGRQCAIRKAPSRQEHGLAIDAEPAPA